MSAPPDSSRDPVLFKFFNEIGIIEQLARNRLERVLPDGLKAPHFGVLNHLVRLGDDTSPLQLARAFQVSKGTMTNTIQRLEARRLIEVRPDPADGRGKRVFLTRKGRAAREACIAAIAPSFLELAKAFPQSKFEEALPFLQAIRSYLDNAPDRNQDRNRGTDTA
ncbi:MAG: MarR family winged helix-turn-helix transcriptional regulator [Alphaproteobacteria bacterium]